MLDTRKAAALSAFQAALSVMLGAFGAHAMKGVLSAEELAWWQTAAQYMMYHALGGMAISALIERSYKLSLVVWLFFFGNIAFCGSLLLMAITQVRVLGVITPVGGFLYLAGWFLAIRVLMFSKPSRST